ncbi:MAG TPA: hypothetical protein VFK14_11700 [Solirubrobacterales bacterium]|nr:hypothetical protein [Solirubrobacterales bacterium]
MVTIEDSFGTAPGSIIRPLYNMVAPGGSPGVFAFEVLQGTYIHLLGRVRSDGQYELAADANDLLSKVPVLGANVTLWGDPSEDSHSVQRRPCYLADEPDPSCTVTETNASFLTMPTSCGAAPVLSARADSWEAPGEFVERTAAAGDREGNPIALAGCNALRFEPTIESKPTTNRADSPSGLEFDLHQPQQSEFDGLSTANLKDTTVTLPEGIALNPSAAGGRKACSSSQIGLLTPVGQASPVHLSSLPQSCPDASKLGRVEVTTPLLDHPMTGSVYLAKPFDNPFGSLLAIYLALEDEESGIIAKLAGRVAPDAATGQLTTTFAESPELPLEDVKLDLYGGARGALTTPLACGTHTTTSTLTPWSTPEGADAHPADSFETVGGCSSSEASAPNNPSFSAGTVSPLAGAYSPFVLRLARADGSQRLGAIEATLPPGLVGKLAGIPYCSEAAIAQAQNRSHPGEGALEEASPSCPQASEVGTATVAAGSGTNPYQVTGHAYWAGPYKGAPLSMVIITPAVAGPFDLGVVAVRTALQVNSETAQIRAVSDPLPSILDGIPLDIRSVEVKLDRPSFTLNPTSCEPMQLTGSLAALSGQSAAVANRFQVGGCSGLAFKPKLKIRLQGPTRRAAYPALKAVVSMPPGGANIASAQVNLPHSEFVAQEHIKTICTRVQFAAGDGNGSACPPGSVYGRAKAWSPLLDKPLEGLVYLRSSSHELPDLVAALDGQVQIAVAGKVDSGRNGGLRNTFEAVPDAPVSRFVLEMSGGKKGLLVNSENLCSRRAKKRRAIARFVGQNGVVRSFKPRVGTSCKRKHGHRHRHRR